MRAIAPGSFGVRRADSTTLARWPKRMRDNAVAAIVTRGGRIGSTRGARNRKILVVGVDVVTHCGTFIRIDSVAKQ